MNNLPAELQKLRESDRDVALVLDAYGELERMYQGALEAMGVADRQETDTMNSAEVTLSFKSSD
ncbi:MAG: hypothetical protein M1539_03250 [Actinobacteria bacterium]|nr:hypothetical protein [Actinomycetota bacterium]